MFGLGGSEILVIVVVALLVFGPSKLPQIARTIKTAYQEFRKLNQQVSKTVSEIRQDIDLNLDLGLDDEPHGRTGSNDLSASAEARATGEKPGATTQTGKQVAPALRAPDGQRIGLRPPEPPLVRDLDNPLPVAPADNYLASAPAMPDTANGADDYLSGGAA